MGFSYEYDAAGQLLWEDTANAAFLPAPSAMGQMPYAAASPINALSTVGTVLQEHDLRGNRTRSATRTWRYDTRNRLVGAQAPGVAAAYGYYPEAGRAWKQVNGVTSLYLEVDGLELAQLDGAGAIRQRYIRSSGSGGAVIATRDQGGLTWLHPNRQGSVIAWTGPNAALRGTASYDAYGNSAQDAAPGPAFRYAGMRLDAETGLYHTPNRAYDPRDGRWMQLDPIGIKDGLNRYAYVRNSPTNFVDLLGLCTGSRIQDGTGACAINGGSSTSTNGSLEGVLRTRNDNTPIAQASSTNSNSTLTPDPSGTEGQIAGEQTPELTTRPEFGSCLLDCASEHYLSLPASGALIALGSPVIGKPFSPGSATKGTSLASTISRKAFGDARFPGGIKLPAPTFSQLQRGIVPLTPRIGAFAGRAVPFVGWGLAAYDVASISHCTYNCMQVSDEQ
ncbi:MAG TPA: RHS repeat-associated core domain-containing protein [Azospirillaceae bacterium]|nr:RHS repeat-associated core domain-containing protein [Azospirillaceae bacterium]